MPFLFTILEHLEVYKISQRTSNYQLKDHSSISFTHTKHFVLCESLNRSSSVLDPARLVFDVMLLAAHVYWIRNKYIANSLKLIILLILIFTIQSAILTPTGNRLADQPVPYSTWGCDWLQHNLGQGESSPPALDIVQRPECATRICVTEIDAQIWVAWIRADWEREELRASPPMQRHF